jgi:hypothetical protein
VVWNQGLVLARKDALPHEQCAWLFLFYVVFKLGFTFMPSLDHYAHIYTSHISVMTGICQCTELFLGWNGINNLSCLGLPQAMILPISTFWLLRISVMSHHTGWWNKILLDWFKISFKCLAKGTLSIGFPFTLCLGKRYNLSQYQNLVMWWMKFPWTS